MPNKEKILIIGSGPAGYTAAIYAARAGLAPLLISGLEPGGQLTITTEVENFPGFENPIQGPWLMEQMKKQAETYGTRILNDYVKSVDFQAKTHKILTEKSEFESHTVVIATGAKAKWLGVDGEEKYRGFGVSACATCDGFFFKNKIVAVAGGGNTAVEEALFLSNLCSKVILIHRRDNLRAEKILQKRLFEKDNIEFLWDSNVKKIQGDIDKKILTSLLVENKKNSEVKEIKIDGFFVAIGHSPTTDIFKKELEMDSDGYIITKADSTKTSIDGVFAAGDVTDRIFRQAVTAAGMGCMSALEAENFLTKNKII
ncbi:MAG: thioredoxin-disulfide reductase [Pelagibacteraceae bacterium TMED65]|nr:thioredoxin-disulfide reductase [Rickettsiales bacterium]OUU51075.1 MAG: thioredoxin-disulfide reductase [Pelagibacteraceae bacterium TMED65]|tara:strand:- start:908 stop:1849 length:942 start_codon:yes stop_codon:yes gene_type:complete